MRAGEKNQYRPPRHRNIHEAAAATRSPLKGRKLSKQQKQAISSARTPERKQKFVEFHVKCMAKAKSENPAKALREYRRSKQRSGRGFFSLRPQIFLSCA